MNKNKIVSLFLSLVMIFSVVLIHDVSANVKDALEKQIEENNRKISGVEDSIAEIEGEKDILDDELSKLKREIDQRNGVIDEYQRNIDEHQKNIDEKNSLIYSVSKEIENTELKIQDLNTKIQQNEEELDRLEKLLAERIREIYKYANNNSLGLDLLFTMVFDMNKDLQEVMDTLHSVSKITENDRRLIEEVKQKRDDIKRDRENLEREIQSLDLYRKDLENQIQEVEVLKAELVSKKEELEAELQKVKDLEYEYQTKYDALDESVKQKREELIRIQQDNEQLERQLSEYLNSINNSGIVGGSNGVSPSGYLRPSTGPITSNYGWRTHPVRGSKSMHTGVDFGGKTGDTIIASRAGEVAFAGWYNNVYGNVVILNHGGGYQTFYAHMSRVSVSKGQVVDQGQRVGFMGSTGLSTGSHLHFEVRKDGSSLNPFNFLTR
ncbi:murein hydrolase activator EnvC family protein [Candidatus Arthromitus sp. SFB-turkey]|uniref:murein hydrolase activator EnvC family protein n=1 Tax=Candidatus Arthromitus sp. SFB-turkey TaxID=1840217 RepID=UPI0007F436AC|nr:M23 family metallopeptidase [Candidatus Arthromitus sp. SFB-turkey]OAT86972.1 peptidase [Candidatus Arthromitus sp. SFB-turkey]HJD00466.1 peptidoglycan DD-metalloendopeptidase family protein [Candidatus Dwaynia gallinarum]